MSRNQSQPNTLCSVAPRSAGFAVVSVNTDQTFQNHPRMPHYPGRVRGICIRVKLRHDICRGLDTNRACKSRQPIESSRGFGHQQTNVKKIVRRNYFCAGAVHEVIWYCHTVGVMYAAPVFLLPVDSMGIHSPKKLSPLEPGLQCQPIIFWVGGAGPINLRPVFSNPVQSADDETHRPGTSVRRFVCSGGLFHRTASVQSGGSFHNFKFRLVIDPTSGPAATSHPAAWLRASQSLTSVLGAEPVSNFPSPVRWTSASTVPARGFPRINGSDYGAYDITTDAAISLNSSFCVMLRRHAASVHFASPFCSTATIVTNNLPMYRTIKVKVAAWSGDAFLSRQAADECGIGAAGTIQCSAPPFVSRLITLSHE